MEQRHGGARTASPEGGPLEVESAHKIDIESLTHEQRDQLRELLLTAVRADKPS